MKLIGYKKIMEIDQIKHGAYIRWIKDGILKKGMFVCDIIINDEIIIKGKTYLGGYINIRMKDCIIFQKLSNDEILINHFL